MSLYTPLLQIGTSKLENGSAKICQMLSTTTMCDMLPKVCFVGNIQTISHAFLSRFHFSYIINTITINNMHINKITIGIYQTFPAGLKKKLTALSNQKDCSELEPWIKAIGNHMYWTAASTPQQDGELMLAKWQ